MPKTLLYPYLSNNFHILNTLIYFFFHAYFKKLQKSHLKLFYQIPPKHLKILSIILKILV